MIQPTINLGPIAIHLYGLIIAISIFLGWYLAKKRANSYKIPQSIFDDPVLLLPLVMAIVGARIYHVLDFADFYLQNPIAIIRVDEGGLGIWGAIAGAILGFWFISKIKKLDFLDILDLASPSLILGQALGRFGNFINQEGFGPPSNLPWAISVQESNRPLQFLNFTRFHPTFFYEMILDLVVFVILMVFAARPKNRKQVFALYLILYSTARFIVEFWRIDTAIIFGVKAAQIFSAVVIIIGFLLYQKQK